MSSDLVIDIHGPITETAAIRLTFYYRDGTQKEITVVGFEKPDSATQSLTPATANTFSQRIREKLHMTEASEEPTGLRILRELIENFQNNEKLGEFSPPPQLTR